MINVFFITTVIGLTFCQTQLTVRRDPTTESFYHFYYSQDTFRNTAGKNTFCGTLNGKCASASNCSSCVCEADHTFVSYKHGCKDLTGVNSLLQGEKCLAYKENATILPVVNSKTFEYYYYCKKLFRSLTFNDNVIYARYHFCTAKTMSTFSLYNASVTTFWKNENNSHIMLDTQGDILCLQRQTPLYNYEKMGGHLMKLNIECKDLTGEVLRTCFIFKYQGSYSVTSKDSTSLPETLESDDTVDTGLIVVIVIIIVLVAAFIVTLLWFLHRRKARRRSSCARYMTDHSDGRDIYTDPVSLKQESPTKRSFNNHFYEKTHNSMESARYFHSPQDNTYEELTRDKQENSSKQNDNIYYDCQQEAKQLDDRNKMNSLYGTDFQNNLNESTNDALYGGSDGMDERNNVLHREEENIYEET